MLVLLIPGVRMEGIAKKSCSHKSFLMSFGFDLCRFLEAFGRFFWFLLFWKQAGLLVMRRISSGAGARAKSRHFGHCKQRNGRWLIAESMTDNC